MSALLFGFLIGMRHALDIDHLAALAVFLSDNQSPRAAARQGIAWGIGHTVTLSLVGIVVVGLGFEPSPGTADLLELAVGVMLILLGLDLAYRRRSRAHQRPPGVGRALGVGLMHGLAGSSALLILTLSTLDTTVLAIAYIALFGIGSIVGMGALSFALSLPLSRASAQASWVWPATRWLAIAASLALGALLIANALSSYSTATT